jgi:lysophospholipase L1-like esterase
MRWRRLVAAMPMVVLLTLGVAGCKDPGTITPPPGTGRPTPTPTRPTKGYPSSMAAIGDSITVAFGSCLVPTACRRNSWSTGEGTTVKSHYRRIMAANPAMRGHAHNYAEAKASSAGLPGQARSAVKSGAEYVTVLIGANDACRKTIGDMTPVATFRSRVDEALTTLTRGLPKADILVVSIPDVYRVWEIGHTNRSAVRVWSLGVCPSLLANPASTAQADVDRRAAFRARVAAYNAQLVAACAAHRPRCRDDNGAVHRTTFAITSLNIEDFFHPNVAGQNQLARVSYPGRFT